MSEKTERKRRPSLASISATASNTGRRLSRVSSETIEQISLEDRRTQRNTPLFALLATVAAVYFLFGAAGTCPSTATRGQMNRAQCTLGVCFAVFFGLLAIASAVGIVRRSVKFKDV